MTNLRQEIGNLPPIEKLELLDALWESLEADGPAPTNEQSSELESRVAGYEQNPSTVASWEQVKAGLFKKQ